MKIRDTFKDEALGFLTKPMLQKFCKDHNLNTVQNRPELLKTIEDFANKNEDNEEIVLKWLDDVLKMGIKTCLVSKIFQGKYTNKGIIMDRIKKLYPECMQEYISVSIPSNQLHLIRYELKEYKNSLLYAQFVFLTKLVKARNTYSESGDIIECPIFVDIDYEKGFIISRCKSMSGLFQIVDGDKIDSKSGTNPEKLMRSCEKLVLNLLEFEYEDAYISKNKFKKEIFKLLDEFTKTPDAIQKEMDKVKEDRRKFADEIFRKLSLRVEGENYADALYDLEIFVEKYLSIYYPDKTIFMKGREAYPTKFLAQDNEFTKIQEQTCGGDDPLQNKKAFFDSKKAVYTSRKCDRLHLCYQRKETKYFGNNPFNVMIYLDRNSCVLKFTKSVEEGDIRNVISRIVQNYDV